MAMADSTQPGEEGKDIQNAKAKKRESDRKYYLANRDAILRKCKEYRERHRQEYLVSNKRYYESNKAAFSQRSKSPEGRVVQKRYRENNKEKLRDRHREWRQGNREHLRAYKKRRRQENPHLALINRIRCRTWGAIKTANARKSARTLELVGCTAKELAEWIESKFTDGMCWARIGEIHVDHLIPLSAFDLSDPEQQAVAFHFTNLRPMWDIENLRKSDRIFGQQCFGFAYADRIAEAASAKPKRRRKRGGRHGDD
jgi:hypothetical protein